MSETPDYVPGQRRYSKAEFRAAGHALHSWRLKATPLPPDLNPHALAILWWHLRQGALEHDRTAGTATPRDPSAMHRLLVADQLDAVPRQQVTA